MTNDNLDVTGDLAGTYIKKSDVENDEVAFTIAGVGRETFEAKDGRAAQTRVVLTSNDQPPRKFSLNKTNLRVLSNAFGRLAGPWTGKRIYIFHDPTITVGSDVKGGQRIRLAPLAPVADARALAAELAELKAELARRHAAEAPAIEDDIDDSMPTLDGTDVEADV